MAITTLQATKRNKLIDWLSTIEDDSILNQISDLMNAKIVNQKAVTQNEIDSIEIGIKDADEGRLNPHSKAEEIYGKWL
jgi:predicted transcriptional regulator